MTLGAGGGALGVGGGALGLADVEAAAARIAGRVVRTPVLTSEFVDAATGATVVMKAEHLQRTGSFKLRGATNALLALPPEVRARGVVAFSSGNHAQAVAAAASDAGVPATIVMPSDAPALKVAGVRRYGGEVVSYDRYSQDREAIAASIAESSGREIIPPYDSPAVIAGQGTLALELFQDLAPVDVLVVPASGGGLSSGCGVVAAALHPGTRLVVVEPAAGDDIKRSLAAGERVRIPQPRTIADGLAGQVPGTVTFPLLQKLVSLAVTVTDAELVRAMVLLFEHTKQVVEPSGAAALAALLAGKVPHIAGARVGIVLSGGNIGAARFAELVSGEPAAR